MYKGVIVHTIISYWDDYHWLIKYACFDFKQRCFRQLPKKWCLSLDGFMDLIDSTGEQMTHAGNSTGLSCPEPWELVEICIHLGIFLGFLSLHLTHDVAAKSAAVTNYLSVYLCQYYVGCMLLCNLRKSKQHGTPDEDPGSSFCRFWQFCQECAGIVFIFREDDSNLHKINKNIFIQIAILLLYHSHNMAAGGYS